ncbi:uroporphyrinogen-III synthase [Aestuariibius sp. 2305UL40-4]|uniref:uroporphyrinogen-III synthase n=1 Tax=Aestuariibius violaceus TaxID=3234132 RepID=UPI00345E41F1
MIEERVIKRGVPVLLTRPVEVAALFAASLRASFGDRVSPVIAPMVETVDHPAEIDWSAVSGIIVTSQSGSGRLGKLGMPKGLSCYCVGERTAAVAMEQGAVVKVVAPDADRLVNEVMDAAPAGPLLYLRGEPSRVPIAARLSEAGLDVTDVVVYAQRDVPLSPKGRVVLDKERPVILPVFSPLSGQRLARLAPVRAPVTLVAISEAAADPARALGVATEIIARNPDGPSMVRAVGDALAMLEPSPPPD